MNINDYESKIAYQESLLRQFYNSKYYKIRLVFSYLKRFLYLIFFGKAKNIFSDDFNPIRIVRNEKKDRSIRVLYDFQTFSAQRAGGISRLFYELIRNLSKKSDVNVELALRYSENIYLKEAPFLEPKGKRIILQQKPALRHYLELLLPPPNLLDSNKIHQLRNYLLRILGLKYINKGQNFFTLNSADYYEYYPANVKAAIDFLNKGDFDIFHPTYYDTYFLKYLKDKPFVLTIHDMIHEKFPKYFSKKETIVKQKKILAKRATKIIAVSEQTKKDVIDILKIPEKKIVVIPHASSFNKNKVKRRIIKDLPKKFLLYVGQRLQYKNFNFFVKAISPILVKNKSIKVICINSHPVIGDFIESEKKLFNHLGISKSFIHLKISDEDLPFLYSRAIAFVYPTLYEGFGIPILEAFSLGCPVVCSDIAVLREIAEDGAMYFNPRNSKSIKMAVEKVIKDKKLRSKMIKRGFELNKKYSWSKTAELTEKVYFDVLNAH